MAKMLGHTAPGRKHYGWYVCCSQHKLVDPKPKSRRYGRHVEKQQWQREAYRDSGE